MKHKLQCCTGSSERTLIEWSQFITSVRPSSSQCVRIEAASSMGQLRESVPVITADLLLGMDFKQKNTEALVFVFSVFDFLQFHNSM